MTDEQRAREAMHHEGCGLAAGSASESILQRQIVAALAAVRAEAQGYGWCGAVAKIESTAFCAHNIRIEAVDGSVEDTVDRLVKAARAEAFEEAAKAMCFRCRNGQPVVWHAVTGRPGHDFPGHDLVTWAECYAARLHEHLRARARGEG